jgi:predicted AAA+ superfamily ATPase
MPAYYPRDISVVVRRALKSMPVVVVTGMRQTGKTTFLRSEPDLSDRAYASLDDFAHLEAAKSDPDGFVRQNSPITIDEAQKCPEIFSAIKRAVDEKRTSGRFLLSGSANFSILKNITESLAGRAIYLAMHPFSRREIEQNTAADPFLKIFFGKQDIRSAQPLKSVQPEDIMLGGMPTVCLRQMKDPAVWFKGFEQTYLERDVREMSQVGNLMALRALLRLTALRTGQLLSPSQLGRDAKLSAATTSRYLSLFEASFFINRIPPYLRNRASRVIKSPKLYLSDCGLAAYLAGLDPSSDVLVDPLYGPLFETYAAQNLSSILAATLPDAGLHFWAVQGRNEVDFVIESGRACIALEFKSASRWHGRDLAGLKAFLSATPHCRAAILCHNGEATVRLGEKLWALPTGLVLS